MFDRFNRSINYLRISVTDKCNLRCTYCMPETGVSLLKHEDIISFEEITDVVNQGVEAGINKIRITGGEPLVRRGITSLIGMIASVEGVKDLAMTTNGIHLEEFARPLAEAGLKRVNVSLDTVDPDRFLLTTRGGDIRQVIKGIVAAKKAGLEPVKINCVVMKSSGEEDALGVAAFCKEMGLCVRYIHRMDLRTGEFSVVEGGEGGDCSICNRLRLTANGNIKPCLFSDLEFNIRKLGVKEAMRRAVDSKPECGGISLNNGFHNIGG